MVPKKHVSGIYFNNGFHLAHFSHARQGAVPPGQGLTLQNHHQGTPVFPPLAWGGEKKQPQGDLPETLVFQPTPSPQGTTPEIAGLMINGL